MGEGRELLQKFRAECRSQADCCEADSPIELALREVVTALGAALATHPAPVPELPEWIKEEPNFYGSVPYYKITLNEGATYIASNIAPDDLDRIAEAARILAARRRAES